MFEIIKYKYVKKYVKKKTILKRITKGLYSV